MVNTNTLILLAVPGKILINKLRTNQQHQKFEHHNMTDKLKSHFDMTLKDLYQLILLPFITSFSSTSFGKNHFEI